MKEKIPYITLMRYILVAEALFLFSYQIFQTIINKTYLRMIDIGDFIYIIIPISLSGLSASIIPLIRKRKPQIIIKLMKIIHAIIIVLSYTCYLVVVFTPDFTHSSLIYGSYLCIFGLILITLINPQIIEQLKDYYHPIIHIFVIIISMILSTIVLNSLIFFATVASVHLLSFFLINQHKENDSISDQPRNKEFQKANIGILSKSLAKFFELFVLVTSLILSWDRIGISLMFYGSPESHYSQLISIYFNPFLWLGIFLNLLLTAKKIDYAHPIMIGILLILDLNLHSIFSYICLGYGLAATFHYLISRVGHNQPLFAVLFIVSMILGYLLLFLGNRNLLGEEELNFYREIVFIVLFCSCFMQFIFELIHRRGKK